MKKDKFMSELIRITEDVLNTKLKREHPLKVYFEDLTTLTFKKSIYQEIEVIKMEFTHLRNGMNNRPLFYINYQSAITELDICRYRDGVYYAEFSKHVNLTFKRTSDTNEMNITFSQVPFEAISIELFTFGPDGVLNDFRKNLKISKMQHKLEKRNN